MAASKIKASDRSKVCQQVVNVLKKEYGSRLPASNYDVLDTLLFSVSLEDSNHADAETAINRLKENFFDYNELRVSSITEIQNAFLETEDPEWKAMRVRAVIQYVFENGYRFDVEDLKKKTMDAAEKQLKKIKSLTPFSISHTLLFALGCHVVPVDNNILNTSIWLGLIPTDSKIKTAGEQLKAAVRKTDVPMFYHLISSLASDPKYKKYIVAASNPDSEDLLATLKAVPARLKDLLAGKIKVPRKPKAKPAKVKTKSKSKTKTKAEKPSKKTTGKKSSTSKKPAKKPTKPAATKKKAATKKTAAAKKKSTAKKSSVKKAAAKKTTPKKSPAKKKLARKKSPAKKVASKATKSKAKTKPKAKTKKKSR